MIKAKNHGSKNKYVIVMIIVTVSEGEL